MMITHTLASVQRANALACDLNNAVAAGQTVTVNGHELLPARLVGSTGPARVYMNGTLGLHVRGRHAKRNLVFVKQGGTAVVEMTS